MKAIGITLAIWIAIFHALFIFAPGIFLLTALVFLGSLVVWLTCVVVGIVEITKNKRTLSVFLALAGSTVILAALLINLEQDTARVRFHWNKNKYQQTVEQVLAVNDDLERKTICLAEGCEINDRYERSKWVYFRQNSNFFGFNAIVYLPTESITEQPTPDILLQYYEFSCERLEGNWYFCEYLD